LSKIEVELTPSDMMLINIIGRNRSLISRAGGIKDVKQGNQDGIDGDILGYTAEHAWAKHWNLFPDFQFTNRSGSPDGKIGRFSYDIKATDYPNGRLLCTLKENHSVDIYVLAIVDKNKVTFVGYAASEELRQDKNIIDLGKGDTYALDQSKLRGFNKR
jgi:hypothetical protein